MTGYRRLLPGRADVQAAIYILTAETGRTPSVLALATHLGLANTTFRRNFPDTCAELSATARASNGAQDADAYTRLKTDNARLRRENRDLTAELDLAIAAIQRLSTDNERLRTALHDARAVTPLHRRP
ncbi:hypothetical protein AB0E78_36260 [Streptomyces sp. NPDC032198]|uniref:hypothetical protein n=1 Tax=Streptomyces sp. NPDC032198 TaxID=3155127 RepID=UPI0033CF5C89